MKLFHFVLTLTGSIQPLTTNYSVQGVALTLQPGAANVGAIFIGGVDALGVATITANNYGVRLPPATAGVPPPPYPVGPVTEEGDGIVPLESIRVLGTANDTLSVSYWGERPIG